MNKFNIVTGCGTQKRVVIRYEDICHIACWKGTKEEAIEAISEKYIGKAKDDYIAKIEQLFDPLDEITEEDIRSYKYKSLCLAAEYGYLDMVQYLVEHRAPICVNNEYPLKISIYNGHLAIVKYLTKQGADIDLIKDSALLRAIVNNMDDIVEYLKEQNARVTIDITAVDRMILDKNGRLKLIEYLLEHSVDADDDRAWLFTWAIKESHLDILKYLIDQRKPISNFNKHAIEYAKLKGNLKILTYLKEQLVN